MPSPIRPQLSHYQQQQLSQVKYLSDMADAHLGRTKSVALRKDNSGKANRRNYNSEYERLRSHVDNSATPSLTRDRVINRTEHLKSLGARAVDTIQ